MSQTYYVATADLDNIQHVFTVLPDYRIVEETRTPDEIAEAAMNHGADVAYCEMYVHGVTHRAAEAISANCRRWMKARYGDKVWNISVDVVRRIVTR